MGDTAIGSGSKLPLVISISIKANDLKDEINIIKNCKRKILILFILFV
tara:strand:- start:433 stop:576 length:144 start_codon:yes stop_codon:yes gene_type:complete